MVPDRKRWLVTLVAIPVLIAAAFVAGRATKSGASSDKPVVEAAPVPTITPNPPPACPDPAPKPALPAPRSLADSLFDRAEIAISEGRVASPPGDNALELILDGEKLEPANPRGAEVRKRAAAALLASAGVLWDHGKQESARAMYADALLFEPDDETAKQRAKDKVAAAPVVRKPSVDEIPWLVSQIDLAIIERRLVAPPGHNALEFLLRLRAIDPTNDATRRLGLEVASALQVAAKDAPAGEQDALGAAAKVATPEEGKPVEKVRDPAAAAELVKKANAALGSGDLASAKKLFEQAITADSGTHAALLGLAEVAYNEGDYTRAVVAGKRAVAMAPRVAAYHMSLGKAFYKLLRYDDAIAQWKLVLQLEPGNAGAQNNIEMAERRMGK